MSGMKMVTVKLPEETLARLRHEARVTGRNLADLIRERVAPAPGADVGASMYDAAGDLAGVLDGPRRAATNARRRFRRP